MQATAKQLLRQNILVQEGDKLAPINPNKLASDTSTTFPDAGTLLSHSTICANERFIPGALEQCRTANERLAKDFKLNTSF